MAITPHLPLLHTSRICLQRMSLILLRRSSTSPQIIITKDMSTTITTSHHIRTLLTLIINPTCRLT